MTSNSITLQRPSSTLQQAFCELVVELRGSGESFLLDARDVTSATFDDYLAYLDKVAGGLDLGRGVVPMSSFWATQGAQVLGIARLRHRLTDLLLQEGGHIGFYVRPSARRRGVATHILAMMLQPARKLGLDRVLITCDSDNVGSARVIEKNGGVLENEIISAFSGKPIRRYWLEL